VVQGGALALSCVLGRHPLETLGPDVTQRILIAASLISDFRGGSVRLFTFREPPVVQFSTENCKAIVI
jgi:hypothetical protein